MKAKNIAIRVDASLRIGTGHLARCLTLADELKREGGRVLFVCRHLTDFARRQILGKSHDVAMLPLRDDASDRDLTHAAWLGVSQADDAADSLALLRSGRSLDLLVVDHYGLDARWETALRSATPRLMALDDIADRPHDVDIFLDQNLQGSAGDRYAGLLPNTCLRLIGPRYALLRPEFRALAADPPAVRDRVNIFFGGTDPDAMTVRAIEALDTEGLRAAPVDIVIGIDNPHRERIAALAGNLTGAALHIQPANLGVLMSKAAFALGAGGATSWERCCLGVPTAIVSIAANQKNACQALAQVHAAFYLGDFATVTARHMTDLVRQMLVRPLLLKAMSRRAATLVDGRGSERVAEAISCV